MSCAKMVLTCVVLAASATGAACDDGDAAPAGAGAPTDASPSSRPEDSTDASIQDAPGPAPALPMLSFRPGDLTTATGTTPIRAVLEAGGPPVAPSLLAAVAAAVELRTYADLALVPARATTHEQSSQTTEPAYVELHPDGPLRDAWHVVSLKTLPAGLRLAPWSDPAPPRGVYAARFHPGSQPTFVRFRVCPKGPDAHRAVFDVSEPLPAAPPSLESALRIDQPATGKSCRHAVAGDPNGSTNAFFFDCVSFADAAAWRLRLSPGLTSSAGVPLRTFEGAEAFEQDLDLANLPALADGCKAWPR